MAHTNTHRLDLQLGAFYPGPGAHPARKLRPNPEAVGGVAHETAEQEARAEDPPAAHVALMGCLW